MGVCSAGMCARPGTALRVPDKESRICVLKYAIKLLLTPDRGGTKQVEDETH